MPIAYKVTVYGCKWGCRRRRVVEKKWMELHEKNCFSNPEKRACKTCKFDQKSKYAEDCYCSHKDGAVLRERDPNAITCRCDCPGWEPFGRFINNILVP